VDEAKELRDQAGNVVVDVRSQDEYTEGHVTEALHIPVDDLLARIDELPKDRTLLFICAMGARSGLACEMAAAMGFDSEKLYNIEEGTPSWIEKGYPTSYGTDS
jgi:hydroxyacylglutathione hydrolase